MKTVNYTYLDKENLVAFIHSNKIAENKNILVQIYTGICEADFIKELLSSINQELPHVNIIGSSTCGEIVDGHVCDLSTILSFSTFDKTEIVTHAQELQKDSYKMAKSLISKFNTEKKAKVAINFVDGLYTNGEAYLNAFNDYHNEIIMAGGLAGDNATFEKTIVFTEKGIVSGAVVALLYNNDLVAHTKANFGWENIGKILNITKSKDNVVYEIDGMRAVDIYAKYLGDNIADELPKTGIEFPLIIKREGLNIPRAVLGRGDDGSLIFAGNINEEDRVTFGYGNVEMIIAGGNRIYEEVRASPVESLFIYSCMARKALMGSSIALELKALSLISPLSGFFTYGEFYTNSETFRHELLNQTMTILSLSESKINLNQIDPFCEIKDNRGVNKTLRALSHLVTQTTLELEDINRSLSDKVEEEVEKNREKEKKLMQQSRLAQMGEMLSMIAHQWRQPLSAISSTSSALEVKAELDKLDKETVRKSAENISKYAQYLSETIDDFRNFFKSNKEELETSLNSMIKSVMTIIQTSIEDKNISLILELNTQKRFVTYPNELKQVILNLIKNAEDVHLEREVEDAYIKITTYSDGETEVLEVSDNAGGISENILNKIFNPYFSTKLKKNGTGLGLYMSKTIVEDHCGGELSVINSGEGAIFKVIINV